MDYTDDLELALPIQGYTNWHSPVNSNFTTIDTKLGKAYQNVWNEGDVTYITNNAKYVTDHWERWNNSKAASMIKLENSGVVTNYFCNAGTGTITWIEDIFGDGSDGALSYSVDTNLSSGIYQCSTFNIDSGITVETDGNIIIFAQESITISGTLDSSGKGGDRDNKNSYNGKNGNSFSGGNGGTSYSCVYGLGGIKTEIFPIPNYINFKPPMEKNYLVNMLLNTDFSSGGGRGANGVRYTIADGYECSNYYPGGSGGAGGGNIILISPSITISGEIKSNGDDGGIGSNSLHQYEYGAGGGGGGSGGLICLFYNNLIETGTMYINGGVGGAGGTGDGGSGGSGSNGEDGLIKKIEV